jgi:NAD(P)H-hydrate epimerase
LLSEHKYKQWVLDAGALQMMDITRIPQNAILTPHHGELEVLLKKNNMSEILNNGENKPVEERMREFAIQYHCYLLLKGEKDIVCNPQGECRKIVGGNGGMTKGGTGDVLAGLIAALACKNDPFLATIAGSFINKKAGDELYKKVGPYFNATDLANQIPITMKEFLINPR